jgi:hypothetical protein
MWKKVVLHRSLQIVKNALHSVRTQRCNSTVTSEVEIAHTSHQPHQLSDTGNTLQNAQNIDWSLKHTQRAYLDALAESLGIQKQHDWYSIKVYRIDNKLLLSQYNQDLQSMLSVFSLDSIVSLITFHSQCIQNSYGMIGSSWTRNLRWNPFGRTEIIKNIT